MTPKYLLYTYQTVDGELECHIYDQPYADTEQSVMQSLGEQLAAKRPGLQFMVLPLEAMPV